MDASILLQAQRTTCVCRSHQALCVVNDVMDRDLPSLVFDPCAKSPTEQKAEFLQVFPHQLVADIAHHLLEDVYLEHVLLQSTF